MDVVAAAGLLKDGIARRPARATSSPSSVPSDRPRTFKSIREIADPAFKRIAIGDPAAVPAGVYAKQYLEKEGLWRRAAGAHRPDRERARRARRGRVGRRRRRDRLSHRRPRRAQGHGRVGRPGRPRTAHRLSRPRSSRPRRPPTRRSASSISSRGDAAARIFERFGFAMATAFRKRAEWTSGEITWFTVAVRRRRDRAHPPARRRARLAAGAAQVSRARRWSRRSCRCRW